MSARRAVVTGASRGLGRAAAAELARRGWRLVLVGRDGAALAATCAQLAGDGHEQAVLDVTDEQAWEMAGNLLEDVQGLVCAAGMLDPVGPVGTYAVEDFRRTLDVNLVGALLAITACLPALRASRGSVVTFSGGGATSPLPRFDAYAASKAALVRLSENIARALVDDGVRVNCVAPGFVATDIHQGTLRAGPALAGAEYFQSTRDELQRGGVPASESAELVGLLLERDPDPPFTGKLISAPWDPWREDSFRRRLAEEPDLATLRRIDDVFFTASGERCAT